MIMHFVYAQEESPSHNYVILSELQPIKASQQIEGYGILRRLEKRILASESRVAYILPADISEAKKGDLLVKFDDAELCIEKKALLEEKELLDNQINERNKHPALFSLEEKFSLYQRRKQLMRKIEIIDLRLTQSEVRAEEDCIVINYQISPGHVQREQRLLTLLSISSAYLECRLNLQEDVLPEHIRECKKAFLYLQGQALPCAIGYLSKGIEEPFSGAFRLHLNLKEYAQNPQLIHGKIYPYIIVLNRENTYFEVPETALQQRQGKNVVFVVRDGEALSIPIQLQKVFDGRARLAAISLYPGEKVVIEGAPHLYDLAKVTVITNTEKEEFHEPNS